MKKIIFTVTNDLTYDRRMQRICTSLVKADYEVVLVGRKLKNSQPFDNQYFRSKRFSLFFNKGKLFYLEYNFRLFFWLLFQDFDIVCAIDLDTILPCFLVKILRGGKMMVYDAHELFTEVPEVINRPLVRKIWLGVECFVVPRLKHCYTVSQSIAEEFERRYNVKFDVIRNLPLSGQSPTFNLQPSTPIILYQGSLNEGRGLETAIEAMQGIENAVLWIAGEGDLSEVLRGMVKEKGLENKVKFLGFIKPENLPSLTAQASIGLNILEAKGLSYQYSLANKFFDYIQAGIPQICVQFIEYQRLNTPYEVAVLIEKTDKTLLIQAIRLLLNNKIEYDKVQKNCLTAAKILCWEEEEKRLIAFYNRF
jgi:glycosyltransferase involved in cell wall biosynthesis